MLLRPLLTLSEDGICLTFCLLRCCLFFFLVRGEGDDDGVPDKERDDALPLCRRW